MYQYSYAEVMAESPSDARATERQVLDKAVALLQRAEHTPPHSPERQQALEFTVQLWAVFIKDLARPDNDLPTELKANLMSVGLGIMAESQRITLGQSDGYAAIAEICAIIRDGLA